MAGSIRGELLVSGSEKAREAFLRSTEFIKLDKTESWGEDMLHACGELKGYIAAIKDASIDIQGLKRDEYSENDLKALSKLSLSQKSELLDCFVETYTYREDVVYHEVYDSGKLLRREKKSQAEHDAFIYGAKLFHKKVSSKGCTRWAGKERIREEYEIAKQCVEEAERMYKVKL